MAEGRGANASVQREASALMLYVALAVCVASQAYIAWSFGALTGAHRASWTVTAIIVAMLMLPTAALLAACWNSQATELARTAMVAIAVAGLLMRLPYFGAGPMLEDDHFRYLLDGAMTAHGLDPYVVAPAALAAGSASAAFQAVAAAGKDVIAQINFPDLRTIYPGTAQILFAVAHIVKPWSIDGLRLVTLLSECATALLCWRLLGKAALPRHLVALVWCNPLMAFSLVGQAHIDAAIGPLLLVAALAVLGSNGVIAGAAVGMAIGVKLWPVMLTPILLRSLQHNRARFAYLAAMSTAALILCAPLMIASMTPDSGLVAYARGWHINNLPYAWASYAGYLLAGGDGLERYLRALVAAVCAAVSVGLGIRPITGDRDLFARLAFMSAAVFYLSPAQFPWYATWFLPFAVLSRSWAFVVATATLPSYFLFFPLATSGTGDLYRYWLSGLHLVPVVVILVMQRAGRTGER